MKVLRLSPSTRRHESSVGSAESSMFLHLQSCLELYLSVPPTFIDNDVPVHSCACHRICEWFGLPHSDKECSTCYLEAKPSPCPTSLLEVRGVLSKGKYAAATQMAESLLAAGADPNETDPEGRTLLSHSVQYLDDSAALTRLLLNNGASVWHLGGPTAPDHSPFTWFLRALILRRRFENCDLTLEMLARVMSERPAQMKAHVIRTMIRHARCPKVLGPIFKRVKEALCIHWANPHSLHSSCLGAIRRRLGGRTGHGVPLLGLPPSLQQSLLMQDLF